jgi:hypothetical protein
VSRRREDAAADLLAGTDDCDVVTKRHASNEQGTCPSGHRTGTILLFSAAMERTRGWRRAEVEGTDDSSSSLHRNGRSRSTSAHRACLEPRFTVAASFK